jgi:D-galactose 1-dehydrogenase
MVISVAVVGIGKIARDQHVPVIAASHDFKLVATASPHTVLEGVPGYRTIEELLAAPERPAAIALCQPPQFRFHAAYLSIEAGRHIFLEKPPGATLSEVEALTEHARSRGVTLFASWHSRCAPAVPEARKWLAAQERIDRVTIRWKEDVRHWHPGQQWIWDPGGLGVFDPGINALSIATEILPRPFFLSRGMLSFPASRAAPIAAELAFTDADGTRIDAAFDWRQTGPQIWDIEAETSGGTLMLSKGGEELVINGVRREIGAPAEYRGLYDRFARLIASGRCDVDLAPLRHVADAFLRSDLRIVAPFED